MQRGIGGQALTETAAAESAPPSIKPNSASRRWRPDLAAGSYGESSPRPVRFNPPQPLNLCCPPDVRARFRPPNKSKARRGRCKGRSVARRGRKRPPPSPRRRRLSRIRPAGGGGLTWPRGAMGYLPQGHFGLIRPNPSTSAVPLTCARGFGHRIKRNSLAARCKG